jgi:hypothetical protein
MHQLRDRDVKRPSFQFYPADWRANAKLRRCSRAERGDWIELLCLLHDSEEYGVLRWPLRDIAKALGCQVGDLRKGLIAKGVLKGADAGQRCEPFIYVSRHAGKDGAPVTLIPSQEGPLWYSSRLVRDEHVRNLRALNDPPKYQPKGSFGGAQGAHLSRDARAHPSSASSASSPSMKNQRRPAPEAEERDDYQPPAAADLKFPEGTTPRRQQAFLAIAKEHGLDREQLQLALDEVDDRLERRERVDNVVGLTKAIAKQIRDGTFYGTRAERHAQKTRGGGRPLSADEIAVEGKSKRARVA